MPLQLEPLEALIGLDALEVPTATGDGQPMLLPIDVIDEDPGQPRRWEARIHARVVLPEPADAYHADPKRRRRHRDRLGSRP